MDIMSMLQGMSREKLNDAMKKAQEFSHTEEGKKLIEKIKNGEKIEGISLDGESQNKIIEELKKNPEVLKKLEGILGKKG